MAMATIHDNYRLLLAQAPKLAHVVALTKLHEAASMVADGPYQDRPIWRLYVRLWDRRVHDAHRAAYPAEYPECRACGETDRLRLVGDGSICVWCLQHS